MSFPKTAELVERFSIHGCGTSVLTPLCAHGVYGDQLITSDLARFGHAHPQFRWIKRCVEGYADHLLHLIDELNLHHIRLLVTSMSAMIGMLASLQSLERFKPLALIGASRQYLDDDRDAGGFEQVGGIAFYDLVRPGPDWSETLSKRGLNQRGSRVLQEVAHRIGGGKR
ncbi:alpha/beta fold hydrolase [Deinococcus oregonensis]|uniref:Alpha/beta fold hydrolase n=1 Tax=Deinococcus oregonensis TaxID=1805970 RepID=A0ABV6B431_9DEIO